jgi:hypothetical protein
MLSSGKARASYTTTSVHLPRDLHDTRQSGTKAVNADGGATAYRVQGNSKCYSTLAGFTSTATNFSQECMNRHAFCHTFWVRARRTCMMEA